MDDLRIRLLEKSDSVEALTELLHTSYAALANLGFRYKATYQDVETTRARAAKGECYVALVHERLIGTILLSPPDRRMPHCEWYDRPEVALVSQFAVRPELQRRGIGSRMMVFVEERARELGASELSLDTAEGAAHLIHFYDKRGYRHVGHAQWDHTNYRSVLMSKSLTAR